MDSINNTVSAVKNTIWGEEGANQENKGSSAGFMSGSTTETHKSMIDDQVTETKYSGKVEKDPMAEGAYDAEKQKQENLDTGNFEHNQKHGETNEKSMSNSNEPNSGSGVQPSVTADPSSGQQNTEKHQGADRPDEDPDSSTGSGESGGGASGGPSGGNSGGMGGMKLPDADKKSEEEGTGTKYEKSTGLQADGGDFDATRPGAAREADRLMEEKGIKHGDANADGPSGEPEKKEKKWYGVDHSGFGGHGSHTNKDRKGSTASTSSNKDESSVNTNSNTSSSIDNDDTDVGEKKGLSQKIKAKLHHNSDV